MSTSSNVHRQTLPSHCAGELDRIRSGYYPSLFYPKIGKLARNLLPQVETIFYIHNFKGSGGGASPPTWQIQAYVQSAQRPPPRSLHIHIQPFASAPQVGAQRHLGCELQMTSDTCRWRMPLMHLPGLMASAKRRSALPRIPGALAGAAWQSPGPAEPACHPHTGHHAHLEGGCPRHTAASPGVEPVRVKESA